MKSILSVILVVLLTACASNAYKQNQYLSQPATIDKLLKVMRLENTGQELTDGLSDISSAQTKADLEKAYDPTVVQQAFREYLLMRLPETNAQAWIKYYSSDFQQKVIKLEEANLNAHENQDFDQTVKDIKQDSDLMAKLDELSTSMQWEARMRAIAYDGLLKPAIYGSALLANAGNSVDQLKLEKEIDKQITAVMPVILESVNDMFLYIYSKLNGHDLDLLIEYYQSPIATYVDDTLVAAISYALNQSSKVYIAAIEQKTSAIVLAAAFDMKSCLNVKPQHVCEILSISSLGIAKSLYIGGASLPRSGKYRVMTPNEDWQRIELRKKYTDDLLMSRKDGNAIFATEYETNTRVNLDKYIEDQLGELQKQLKYDAKEIKINGFTNLEDSQLFELCYNYVGVDVCKIVGGANIDGGAVYIHSLYLRDEEVMKEVASLFVNFEAVTPLVAN